ncbi:[Protein-PII] uridylyltransferase [hydrothermal vent metagenome]|uniref:[Protein-PII] uridylyltransferase n=1 Tax=hydrothermal vent metagenome TaxID=652676 RepID=A0A3B1E5J5_9ZZZZ
MSNINANQDISLTIKDAINKYRKNINNKTKDINGISFCLSHCKMIDTFIVDIYAYVIKEKFKDYNIDINNIPIILIAMGSYGRMQMSVYSDVDFMIVYEEIDGFNTKSIIEGILHIAWDSRLNISHRVHELQDIQNIIKTDNTIQTAIFESRFIYGSRNLHSKFKKALDFLILKNKNEFITNKVLEYNSIDIDRNVSMEINLKHDIGTLRDINMLMWIAKYSIGISSIKELYYKNNLLTQSEYIQLKRALNILLSIRSNLHILSGKQQDVLFLEIFPDLAQDMKKSKNILPQVLLSKNLFFATNTIYKICHTFIAKLSYEYLPILKDKKNYLSNAKKIHQIDNKAYIDFALVEQGNIDILQEILDMQDKHMYFDGSIFYAISKLSQQDFISKFGNPKIITSLLKRQHLYCILRLFYDTQTLHYVFSEFRPIMHIGQFDGYHQYPVGFHCLRVLWNMENIKDSFVSSIYNAMTDKDKVLLKYCAIFHDLGKGRKTDHSFVGAYIFAKNAKNNNFSSDEVNIGKTLIKYHTFMSKIAYQNDIHSEQVLISFCAVVPSEKLINMLYILTYADNLGTRDNSLTSHKKYLLKELYNLSIGYLENKDILKYEVVRAKKEEALRKDAGFIQLTKKQQQKILSIPSSLLFIKYSKKDILNIAMKSFHIQDFVYEMQNEDFLSIEIIRKTPLNLGYLLSKLSFLNLAHLDIYKIFDDIKYFKINFSSKIEQDNIQTLKYDILNSFDMSKRVKTSIQIDKKNISLDKNHTSNLAKMIISGKNQKGFFAYISRIFDELGIDIRSAKIHTVRDRIQDILLIEKNNNFDLHIDEAVNLLSNSK